MGPRPEDMGWVDVLCSLTTSPRTVIYTAYVRLYAPNSHGLAPTLTMLTDVAPCIRLSVAMIQSQGNMGSSACLDGRSSVRTRDHVTNILH